MVSCVDIENGRQLSRDDTLESIPPPRQRMSGLSEREKWGIGQPSTGLRLKGAREQPCQVDGIT